MIDQLKDLKDMYESARSQIDKLKEPLEDLQKMNEFLKAVAENPALLNDNVDQDYKRYFFEDFTQGVLKRLTREKSKDDRYLEVIGSILQQFLIIFVHQLKAGIYHYAFFDSVRLIFDFETMLHQNHFQVPEDELKKIKATDEEKHAWRKELKAGDMVDAIQDEVAKASGWSQARISQATGDTLHLEFILDTKSTDRYLDRWSVDLAPFESKTKEIFEYKKTLQIKSLVDGHDKSNWNKSTILDLKDQQVAPDRTIKLAFVAFRIYVEKSIKTDEVGPYEGWSNRFDEWISLYSPRIQPFHTKTQKGVLEDFDIDEELDNMFQPSGPDEKVFAVPRLRKCTSSLYINLINVFGNKGGFDAVLEILKKSQLSEEIDLNIVAVLLECVSKPYLIYHSQFQHEYCPKLAELGKQKLQVIPDRILRDLKRERLEGVVKSIDYLSRRNVPKADRELESENLKLHLCNICLRSSYLDRKIQGLKDLNQIIKNNRYSYNQVITNEYLIDWMHKNDVFSVMFDNKKTHLQIVQRAADILRLLLNEDKLTLALTEMFWNLSKSDYKPEVYKIVNEGAPLLKQEHMDFICEQIQGIPREKVSLEEFGCLAELEKYSVQMKFKDKVRQYFWNVVCNSDQYSLEMVQDAIDKLAEIGNRMSQENKNHYFAQLSQNLVEKRSSIASLRLFKKLLRDQFDQATPSSYIINKNYMYPGDGQPEPSQGDNEAAKDPAEKEEPEFSLKQHITDMIKNGLADTVINNLADYCEKANAEIEAKKLKVEDRKKVHLVSDKYSHHEEIDERLQFLKYLAQVTDYQISKVHLGAIYELLVHKSNVSSDYEQFLIWCKRSCEQSTNDVTILDLNEVGEFFIELMNNGQLDLQNLILVGFDFLSQYFLTTNEKDSKILKAQPKKKEKKPNNMDAAYMYGSIGFGPLPLNWLSDINPGSHYKKKQEEEDDDVQSGETPVFKLVSPPATLQHLNIIWEIALKCQNEKVIPKAVNFLIRVYTELDDDLRNKKSEIQDELIERCVQLLRETQDSNLVIRVLHLLKNVIFEAEKKGTGGVQPHNAVLKGELLEKIRIRNKASTKKGNLTVNAYSNTTVWELREAIAEEFELAPKYLKLEKENGVEIDTLSNGKTIADVGIKGEDIVIASKYQIEDEVACAPLVTQDGKIVDKALQIFNEWFTMYSDENDQMTRDTCVQFIKGCTGEIPPQTDDRVLYLFKVYDKNNDGKIERSDFLSFYETSCKTKPDTVRENLRAHNIRDDLKKLSEIQEESSFQKEDMPRFKMSKNQEYFDLFMKILDRRDSASESSWDLIQMLATNEVIYKRVLELQTAKDEHARIDWSKFFDSSSVYKLLYTLQIVEAVMEDSDSTQRIVSIAEQDRIATSVPPPPPNAVGMPTAPPPPPPGNNVPPVPGLSNIPPPPHMVGVEKEGVNGEAKDEERPTEQEQKEKIKMRKVSSIVEDQKVELELRAGWTKLFLDNHGFEYILNVFLEKDVQGSSSSHESFQHSFNLKHIAFALKMLRIFITAAFSSLKSSPQIENENEAEGGPSQQQEAKFKQLQELVKGERAAQIIGSLHFRDFQVKVLNSILSVLDKQELIFEDRLIVENALSLWVVLIKNRSELVPDFYSYSCTLHGSASSSEALILRGLLYCRQERIREEFFWALEEVALQVRVEGEGLQPIDFLLGVLTKNFEQISQYSCKQYFDLFCILVDEHFRTNSSKQFDPQQMLVKLIDKVKEFNAMAKEHNAMVQKEEMGEKQRQETENIYIGLLSLTEKIIENFQIEQSISVVQEHCLIEEIFAKFLFQSLFREEVSTQDLTTINVKQKCIKKLKGDDSGKLFGKRCKDQAYKLLNSLIKRSEVLMNDFLEKSLLPLMKQIRRIEQWNYQPPSDGSRSQKYVGLRNLGCICYMNSMIQQFFMIPAFRYNLLSVDDGIPEERAEYKGFQIDDNVLHQFQKLIAHLELSDRSDYNPFEFCFAFKDLDGNPTNTGEQKDAQEFLNLVFDRVENQLRHTSRKYLLQSVFGGQTCSQMVCSECGKVRNRIEDFYNLSLPVKDIKSMQVSLKKMIEGETISDYLCDGCNKKVDISRRTLISQTPNVLIVHLQRIIFNFDTFRNDKINSFWEFPTVLDLKPYSFYEVMRQEKRLGGQGDEEEEQKQVEVEEDNQWPEEEDCFEYKLVGATVHSGTANAGHYWSYINTLRGFTEPNEVDPNWAKTESDPWMEFNDSSVRDFKFEKLRDECFGGDKKSETGFSGFSFSDSSYGKSAYMLVYERRKKKPLKILLQEGEEQLERERQKGVEVKYDEKKQEWYKLIDYRDGVEEITPNQIYKQVMEDNMKFEFETDIYSQQFFDFISGIVKSVSALASTQQSEMTKNCTINAMLIAKKTILEIVAKCFNNRCIAAMMNVLIGLMKQQPELCELFLVTCQQEDDFDYIFTLMLECLDMQARLCVAQLLKHVVGTLKLKDKDILYEREEVEVEGKDGSKAIASVPKSKLIQFIEKCLINLNSRVAKHWLRFEHFLEVLAYFAVGDLDYKDGEDEVENERQRQMRVVGLEYCLRTHLVEKFCDFILGKKSPLMLVGEKRVDMGGSYSTPNFSPLIKVITRIITDEDGLLEKFPMNDMEKNMMLQHDLLKVMLGSSQGSEQFGNCLASMCRENYKLSKKVSKVFVRSINNSNYDTVKNYLTALKPFIQLDDSLKKYKLEWVFGFSQIYVNKGYRDERLKYGIETLTNINEEASLYTTPLTASSVEDPLLGQLLKCKGRLDTFCVNCLKELLSLMVCDEEIAEYIYAQGPPTYQNARYVDWIKPYLDLQKEETEKNATYSYMKAKFETILESLKLYEQLDQTFLAKKRTQELEKAKLLGTTEDFQNLDRQEDWLAYENPDVIPHYPPQVVIGRQIVQEEGEKKFFVYDEHPLVSVVIEEIVNEYNYGNPTKLFNISIPHIDFRVNNYQSMGYGQFKQHQQDLKKMYGSQQQAAPTLEPAEPEPAKEEAQVNVKVVNWHERAKQGNVLLKVVATSKEKKKLKIRVFFESQNANAKLPVSYLKCTFNDVETKHLGHISKIDPTKPWGDIKVRVEVVELASVPAAPTQTSGKNYDITGSDPYAHYFDIDV